MRRELSFIKNNGYPYYLHNNEKFCDYWKKYFEKYPITDNDRIELYIDFPFCRSICKFCVFGSCIISEYKYQIQKYADSVVSLVEDMKDIFPNRINNIYFGGGTPSLWPRESLKKIVNNIPAYHNANTITIETHPADLTEDWLNFVVNDLSVKTVSIGIQSFDIQANKNQHRIPADIDKVKWAVDYLHEHRKFVNIDVVALFDEDNEEGWEIFKRDLEITADIHPDDICSSVNFRVPNYYGKSIRYREMLKEFLTNHPEYVIEHDYSLSTNMEDIINYGEEPYHLRTHNYNEFFNNCRVGILDAKPDIIKENIIIGFGGSPAHGAISSAGKNFERIYSYYDFNSNKLIHQVSDIKITPNYQDGGTVPHVRIGNCNIDTNFEY